MNKKNKPQKAEYYVDFESWHIIENATPRQILRAAGKDTNSRDLVSGIDGGMTRIHPCWLSE